MNRFARAPAAPNSQGSARHQRKVMSAGTQRRRERSVSNERPHQPAGECGCFDGGTAECFRPRGEIRLGDGVHSQCHRATRRKVMVASTVGHRSGGPTTRASRVNRAPTVSPMTLVAWQGSISCDLKSTNLKFITLLIFQRDCKYSFVLWLLHRNLGHLQPTYIAAYSSA